MFEEITIGKTESLYEVSLSKSPCEYKTLILCLCDGFVPSVRFICSRRNKVTIAETEEYFTVIKIYINDYDCFIMAGRNLNLFEAKIFHLIAAKLDKKILHISHNANI
ncbi:hypothetical protein ENBRE01_0267 [Enteropsectra breve]|nr:hypothetical protein ENBRE01_0267 [Enteropsectra breve]